MLEGFAASNIRSRATSTMRGHLHLVHSASVLTVSVSALVRALQSARKGNRLHFHFLCATLLSSVNGQASHGLPSKRMHQGWTAMTSCVVFSIICPYSVSTDIFCTPSLQNPSHQFNPSPFSKHTRYSLNAKWIKKKFPNISCPICNILVKILLMPLHLHRIL